MKNIQTLDIDFYGKITTFVIINHGNNQFTSMPKSVYDAQQVEHLTEIPTV